MTDNDAYLRGWIACLHVINEAKDEVINNFDKTIGSMMEEVRKAIVLAEKQKTYKKNLEH